MQMHPTTSSPRSGAVIPLLLGVVLGLATAAAAGCEGKKPRAIAFVPDAPVPSAPSVSLQLVELTADRLVVDLVGVGLTDLYGLAFRLGYAPTALRFASLQHDVSSGAGSGYWPAGDATLAQAAEATSTPGLLVVGITRRGAVAGQDTSADPATPTILARLTFDRLPAEAESTLQFLPARSAAFDSAGAADPTVTFHGARLERR